MTWQSKWHIASSRYCQTSLFKDSLCARVRVLDVATVIWNIDANVHNYGNYHTDIIQVHRLLKFMYLNLKKKWEKNVFRQGFWITTGRDTPNTQYFKGGLCWINFICTMTLNLTLNFRAGSQFVPFGWLCCVHVKITSLWPIVCEISWIKVC